MSAPYFSICNSLEYQLAASSLEEKEHFWWIQKTQRPFFLPFNKKNFNIFLKMQYYFWYQKETTKCDLSWRGFCAHSITPLPKNNTSRIFSTISALQQQ